MKRSIIGVIAHVDAGKTTLTEAMLFKSGARDKLGRVDKRDAFLDTHSIERERGITVFSKQAILPLENTEVTIIDTPGHIDFTPETERSLSVQDYAILVVSAPEGVMPHTMTLYNLLSARKIPTFIFVNKTDIAERRRIDLIGELKRSFGTACTDFNLEAENQDRFFEECAGADETLMEDYFECGAIERDKIASSIKARRIIPCIFGSALKCEGVGVLLRAIDTYTIPRRYSQTVFGAKVYKIATDPTGARLTYLKITGGSIAPKDTVRYVAQGGELISEKIEGIRLYSADKYKSLKIAEAGSVCAVVGLTKTQAGMGIGSELSDTVTVEPVLDYRMIFNDKSTDVYDAYLKLSPLIEEDPSLGLRYDSKTKEIRVKLMGDIQTEVLTRIIKDRFGFDVSFGEGSILYKETINDKVYGAGHFEPLMHYAEVRLRLEPAERGAGLIISTNCPQDRLKTNWQRLILSHLEGRAHRGVLTRSPITDMKITLIAGRAHPKHTEGGDFREATFRALRQGLMKADSMLLEPTFDFTIELPADCLGKAMTDISNMHGECEPPEFFGDIARISGNCPVYTMRSYAKDLRAYTHGAGRITLTVGEYAPCHNAEQIIAERGYDPESDTRNYADSIFCKNGSGYIVPWYEADAKMHTENPEEDEVRESDTEGDDIAVPERARAIKYTGTAADDKELMKIFESTYGKIKRRSAPERIENAAKAEEKPKRKKAPQKGDDYLIIDGYNLIVAWDELKALADAELSHARDTLIRLICNYRGYKKCTVILVFDAYKRKENEGSVEEIGGITVVYTKERQTADAYIEKATYSLTEKNSVRVVTSDFVEQLVVLGNGATRVSAREFIAEINSTAADIKELTDR